jgi:serine/threonine protein kinase
MSDLNAMNLEPGEVVGGYELVSRLGGGAMGSVWRVSDGGGQTYAMKILRDSFAEEGPDDGMGVGPGDDGIGNGGNQTANGNGYGSDDGRQGRERDQLTARERLRREAMALQKVRHPGVCSIVDMELDDSLAFIVTELIEGKNLRQDVDANGRYTGDDLERLARKLIDAVKAVHAAGIVHRDIKPTNVMISASGPVLVDFGIAMGEGESHVTRTGLVMGTPGFIAPEIIDGAESDEATDWWSLASVLAFSATGHPVFGTKPMMAVLEREASGNANLTGLPAGTMAALRTALNPNPRRRNSPDELLRAISLDALNPFAWEDAQAGSAGLNGQNGLNSQTADSTNQLAPNGGNSQGQQGLQGHEPQGNGAMRPFESGDFGPEAETRAMPSLTVNPDNPRSLWPRDDAGTQLLPHTDTPTASRSNAAPTMLVPANQDGETRTVPTSLQQSAAAPTVSLRQDGTTPFARIPNPQGEETVNLRAASRSNPDNADAAMPTTAIDPATRPALQRLAGRSTAFAAPDEAATQFVSSDTTFINSQTAAPSIATSSATMPLTVPLTPSAATYPNDADAQAFAPTSVLPTSTPAPTPEFAPRFVPASTAPATAVPAAAQASTPDPAGTQQPVVTAPEAMPPNPADIRRAQTLARGRIALWMLTIPVGLLMAGMPVIALITVTVLLWMLFAAGFNESAQLDREARRGGVRKGSDTALRLATLPWHIVKALPAALGHAALLLVSSALITAVAALVVPLPVAKVYVQLHNWAVPLLLPPGGTWSASAAALGAAGGFGWLFAVLVIRSANLTLGAGSLLTAPPKPRADKAAATGADQAHAGSGYAGEARQQLPANSTETGTEPPRANTGTSLLRKRVLMPALWVLVTLAALAVLAANQPISWEPLMALASYA